MNDKSRLLGNILLPVALVAIVGILYFRTVTFGYIRLDDFGYTAGCPFVAGGLSWSAVKESFSHIAYGGIWMPLTYMSYAADLTLFGAGWGGHHATNALLHAINAIFVFLFLQRLTTSSRTQICAFLAAAFWAVHPQRVEAVAWIASRKDELFTLFTLAGLMAWHARRYALGLVCCALSCMSKPTAVCFPLLAALVELYRGGGIGALFPAALRYGALLLMAGVTGLAAVAAQTHPEGMAAVAVLHVPLLKRLVLAAWGLLLGLAQTIIPCHIHIDYLMPCCIAAGEGKPPHPRPRPPQRPAWRSALVFAAFFYLLAYLPVSGVFGSFGETFRADRFLYLPAVAIAFLIHFALLHATKSIRWGFALAVVAYAAAAWPVISSYRNDYTVFARTLELAPKHWRALSHVGAEYCAHLGRMDEGIELMRESYRQSPRESTAETLSYALACRGNVEDVPEIRRLVSRFVKLEGGDKRGMFAEALGIAEMLVGDWAGAETCLRASIAAPKRFYANDEARLRLAQTLLHKGDKSGAAALLRPLIVSDSQDVRQRAIKSLGELNQAE